MKATKEASFGIYIRMSKIRMGEKGQPNTPTCSLVGIVLASRAVQFCFNWSIYLVFGGTETCEASSVRIRTYLSCSQK